MYDDLTRLAIINGADKFGYHNYTPNYYTLLHARRNEPLKLLEIGVGGYGDEDRGGYSLRMWRDFFPNALVVGIDIHPKKLDVGDRITICQGSQVDDDFLNQVVKEHGPFDIIVDDGSHFNEHVVETYRILYPGLNPGGIYIVEDVQTAFRTNRGGSLTLDAPNTIGYFFALQCRMGKEPNDELAGDVVGVDRFHNMIAVHKSPEKGWKKCLIDSSRIAQISGPLAGPPRILFVSDETSPESELWHNTWSSRFRIAVEARLDPANGGDAKGFDEFDKFDLIVCRLPESGCGWNIHELFALLDTNGLLCISEGGNGRISSPRLVTEVKQLFVELDHLELLANYPDAKTGPMASHLQAMESYHDGFLFYKADNTFPSNFAFNFRHRAVQEAMNHINAVLAEEWSEDGLLQAADMMRRAQKLEQAQAHIDKIFQQGATRRMSYLLAAEMARETGDTEKANQIHELGFQAFPGEVRFALKLADQKSRQGEIGQAEAILRQAIGNRPRHRLLHASLTEILRKQRRWAEAIESNSLSIKFHPRPERPALSMIQAEMFLLLDQPDAALREIHRSISDVETYAPSYRLLSELELQRGNPELAMNAISTAIELDPQNAEFEAIWKSLSDAIMRNGPNVLNPEGAVPSAQGSNIQG